MVPNVTTRGRLLVATPPLDDPNFDRSVVYMIEHHENGAVGVVLNRPGQALAHLRAEHDDALSGWIDLSSPPYLIFSGGPVATESLIALASGTGRSENVWGVVTLTVGTVDLTWSPQEAAERIDYVRFFRGYSGWGPGQLESEIEAGAWMTFDADIADVFTITPSDLWRDVVRRQGGHLRWIADAPTDLSAN
jgi:putative transcriptional regulator